MIPGDTEILTSQGWTSVANLALYDEFDIFNARTGQFIEGYAGARAKFDLAWTYRLVPNYNTSARVWEFKAPRPCCVNLKDTVTYDLRVKDVLRANTYDCGYDADSWGRGFMFKHKIESPEALDPRKYPLYQERLTALKTLGQMKTHDGSIPSEETPSYKGSFIRGYLSADGNKGKLVTSNEALFKFFLECHGYAGLVLTGADRKIRKFLKVNRVATFYDDYEVTYSKGADFPGFRVLDISEPSANDYPLYTVYMPEGGDYVIKGGWTVQGD